MTRYGKLVAPKDIISPEKITVNIVIHFKMLDC